MVGIAVFAFACHRSEDKPKDQAGAPSVAEATTPAAAVVPVAAVAPAAVAPAVETANGSTGSAGSAAQTGAQPAAGAVAAIDAGPGAELVVTAVPPRPGTSSIVTYDAKLDQDFNFGGLQIITSSTQSKKKKVEIVAVDPDGTVHKRITYLKLETRRIVDGELKKDDNPIRGKTYLLTWKDSVVAEVQLPGGKPASPEEVEAVKKEETRLQTPEVLGKALDGLRLVKGQAFEVPSGALERLIQGGEFHARRMVLTYRGKTREGTRIDAEGAVVNNELKGLRLFVDLKGELLIDRTGWCRSLKVTGQVRAELNGVVVGSGAGSGATVATALR